MNKLISFNDVSFSYGEISVLENISFDIEEDDFIAIIGPNGSGKTTLVKLILGFLSQTKGTIKLHIPRDKIGYVPQRYTLDKNFPGTVKEILSTKDMKIVEQLELDTLLDKKFMSLSGGQQQRVLIALALERKPKLLVLDEPTAGVDINSQKAFYRLLQKLNKQGTTILLITHEIGVIPSLVKKVLCINHNVCCLGTPDEIPKFLKKVYGPHFVHHHHGEHQHD